MRWICAIFAGVMGAALVGGVPALAQQSEGGTWVNPAFSGSARTEAFQRFSLPTTTPASDDISLGFTIPGTLGVTGRIELGRATLGPSHENGLVGRNPYGVLGNQHADEQVGEATIRWNVTPRFQVNTSLSRDFADGRRIGGAAALEESVSGGVSYSVTPRFAVNARGVLTQGSGIAASAVEDFNGDSAEIGAHYEFMPYFTGSVNYTYESYDGGEGVLRHDESTLSISVTGRF